MTAYSREQIHAFSVSYHKFVALVNAREHRYLDNDANRKALQKWLREAQLDPFTETEWSAAYVSVDGNGLLEQPPVTAAYSGTGRERLQDVGVTVNSGRMTQADRAEQAQASHEKVTGVFNEILAGKDKAARKAAISDAQQLTVYTTDGRINHAASQAARKKALAALGITED
jgi:hypothetical protein